jgi:hypothetical protein
VALNEAILSKGSAELALIYLFDRYEFDLVVLKARLVAKGLAVSFSKVKYDQIAPFVGLEPSLRLRDAPTFEMHRARIPNGLFKEIIGDIEIVMKQYGPPMDHKNEEARSRFLAPVFNRIIALFGLLISNTPESIMPGRIATKGRQFRVFGGLTVVYIEVKLEVGTGDEHLNAVAQLIAEADGCDYANSQLGFGAFPIYGILCDGKSFEFFCFDSSTKPPTFSRCQHSSAPPARYALSVADLSGHSTMDFIASLRPVCETIFYFLILGYTTGIHAQCQQSCSRGEESGKRRESTDAWQRANRLAEQAMQRAIAATAHAATGDYIQADKVAKDASEHLKASIAVTPAIYQRQECDIMQEWDEDRVNAA